MKYSGYSTSLFLVAMSSFGLQHIALILHYTIHKSNGDTPLFDTFCEYDILL